jgi:isoleucyl-tRNA synthetase
MNQKNYKDTLNLPRTDFPMKANLTAREPELLKMWNETRLYQQIQRSRQDQQSFVLHDGPPFANGDVHMGTALNKILKDFVVKSQTMLGKRAPYVPGWDCHGLPIEYKVVNCLRLKFAKNPKLLLASTSTFSASNSNAWVSSAIGKSRI